MKIVLVVSSDLEVQSIAESRLSLRGYRVLNVSSLTQALEQMEREAPDLILFDSEVEKISEAELITRIRSMTLSLCIPIILIADQNSLSTMLMSVEKGFDDFITKPLDAFQLLLRVALNLKRVEVMGQANPLSKLPGNVSINRFLENRIQSGGKFSVCYFDINGFKAFNDRYGYSKGDDVIKQTARIIVNTLRQNDAAGSGFVGHVGGDDFIAVVDPTIEEAFSMSCIEEFDRLIPTHYLGEDKSRGYIEVENRKGQPERFALMGLTVAAVTNLRKQFSGLGEIAQRSAEVKKFLKLQGKGSHYLRDRREEQMDKIEDAERILSSSHHKRNRHINHVPLGQVLLLAGLITESDLEVAIKKHLETGQRLGRVLISMDCVSSEDVGRMLEKKMGVPYHSLSRKAPEAAALQMFTKDFMAARRVVPLKRKNGGLELGMVDPFDLKTIDSIEQSTDLQIEPKLVLEDEFELFINSLDFEKTAEEMA